MSLRQGETDPEALARRGRRHLTAEQVHHARTSGEPDSVLAYRWRHHPNTVRDARVGVTWADHPTAPDTKPRAKRGNWGDL